MYAQFVTVRRQCLERFSTKFPVHTLYTVCISPFLGGVHCMQNFAKKWKIVCALPVFAMYIACTGHVHGHFLDYVQTMFRSNRVSKTEPKTQSTLCMQCVGTVFFWFWEKIQSLCIFVKTQYVQTMYISKTEFQLFGYRNRVTFEFICTHWENFIPTLRILQLDSLSRLAKDFVIAPIFFLVLTAAI